MVQFTQGFRLVGVAIPVVAVIVFIIQDLGAVFNTGAHAAMVLQSVQTNEIGASGHPVPRFVSLKKNRANVRKGPSRDYSIAWEKPKMDVRLPVEIIREFELWRMIRDSEGEEGWVHGSLLSGARAGEVAPWDHGERFRALREDNSEHAGTVASLEPRVVVDIKKCDGAWCNVEVDGYRGWIEQSDLWGVYVGERFTR
jgi:SH3-like domain-containing protein